MKMTLLQVEKATRRVLDEWKKQELVTFKAPEERVFKRAVEILSAEIQKESDLDKEVHKMIAELEKQNSGAFDRRKMFAMIKKRLAQERGVVL